jgi:adenosine/AMP kinase
MQTIKFSEIKQNAPDKRRTEVMIETHSLTIIRIRGDKKESVFCHNCGRNVQSLAAPHAALIFIVDAELLAALLYSKQVHAVIANQICAASLADYFNRQIRFVED